MKKNLILVLVCFAWTLPLSAQITREQATEIVMEHLDEEMMPFITLYTLNDIQLEGFLLNTSQGGALELDFAAWVYYLTYANSTKSKYLFVHESKGNVLEINLNNCDTPIDFPQWIVVPIIIPIKEYFFKILSSQQNNNSQGIVHIINSKEELNNYFISGYLPNIDFSKYTLLLAHGEEINGATLNTLSLQQLSVKHYVMNVDILLNWTMVITNWQLLVIVNKIADESDIELIVTRHY